MEIGELRAVIEAVAESPDEVDGEWDSLFQLKAVMAIEQHYDVKFETQAVASMQSLESAHGSLLMALHEPLCKCIVTDLDGVIWSGILGEGGAEVTDWNKELQEALLEAKEQGALLAVASKNNATDAQSAIETVPGMVLSRRDFSTVEIHWRPKEDSIEAIADRLNIGLDSIVFLDDSPHEQQRVRQMLPQVRVPEKFDAAYVRGLNLGTCGTDEDGQRTELITQEAQRENYKAKCTPERYLKGLEQVVTVEPLSDENIERASQLFQKANQCHLDLKRWTVEELKEALHKGSKGIVISVQDRFGNAGRVGVALTHHQYLEAFVVSCRVLGRGVEQALLAEAGSIMEQAGIDSMTMIYDPGPRNEICLQVLFDAGSKRGILVNSTDPGFPQQLSLDLPVEFPSYIARKEVG